MEESKTGNIQSIQFLRGIASIMVLLGHIRWHFLPAESLQGKFCGNGWMGVEIFFIISGFILPYAMHQNGYNLRQIHTFFLKRLVRIEPAYMISVALAIALFYVTTLTSWYTGKPLELHWGYILGHFLYINAFTGKMWINGVYWTLAVEFEFYVLIALAYMLLTNQRKWIMYTCYLALLALTFVVTPLRDKHILFFLPFFLLGVATFLYRTNLVKTAEFAALVVVTLIITYIIHGAALCIVSAATVATIILVNKIPKVLLFPGTVSFSLYLTHNLVRKVFMSFCKRHMQMIYPPLSLLCLVVLCLGFAYLYYRLVEKPFINLSKRIKYRPVREHT